ncbi:MAG: ABC transporter permease [Planctomycetes bacterium]|nr:ABC transporter permease [Planctomycetota bacterium]
MNLLHISLRNMRVRLLSSSLTVASIALGAALLATIWLLTDEAKKRYAGSTSVVSYSLIVGPKEGSPLELVLNTVFNYGISQGLVPYSVYKDLHDGRMRRKGMVRYAIPQARGDNYRGYPIIGTTDEMFSRFRIGVTDGGDGDKESIHLKFAAGEPFRFAHEDLERFVGNIATDDGGGFVHRMPDGSEHVHHDIPQAWRKAVIGSHVANRLGLKLGSTFVPVHGVVTDKLAHEHKEAECTVVGVLARTGTPLDRSIYIPLSTFLSMDKHEAIRKTQEKHKENVGLSAILVSSVRTTAAQRLRYDFQTLPGAQGAVPFYEIKRLLDIIGDSTDVLEVLSYIVLLVTGSTVLLGLYNTMNERRREIAIMRSLGARRSQITVIILQEALLLSLAAGALGVVICHGAVWLGSSYIERRTGITIEWGAFNSRELLLILGVGVLGAVAGIVPALKGARTPVAENLGPTS